VNAGYPGTAPRRSSYEIDLKLNSKRFKLKFMSKSKLTAGLKCKYNAMIFAHSMLTNSSKILAAVYLDLSELEGHAFAGQPYLCSRTGLSTSTLTTSNIELVASGLFAIQYRPNHASKVTPDLERFASESLRFKEHDRKLRAKLKTNGSRSPETGDPDCQELGTGSPEIGAVIPLDNRSTLIKESKKDGAIAALVGGSDPVEETNILPVSTQRNSSRWPVDGLDTLMAIHPPASDKLQYTTQMYYKMKRLHEGSVAFKFLVERLKDDVIRPLISKSWTDPTPQLANWLGHERWTDERDEPRQV
jgi:hypothetical protein